MSARLAIALVAACVTAGVGAVSALGAGRPSLLPPPDLAVWRPPTQVLQVSPSGHRVLRPTRLGRLRSGSWWGGPVTASTGETVTVFISDRIAPSEEARAGWANFFAGLYHGAELGTVGIFVAPYDEVKSICGGGAGCYSPSARVMVVPGDLAPGVNADIAAHEYGHHVAASRQNEPWSAVDWGPKRWASYVGVCARTAAGALFPGDEGDHYSFNPGEAFAEAYRALNQQRGGTWGYLPLVVDPSLAPDAGSLGAALADVQQPWTGPAAASWTGRFGAPPAPVVKLSASVGPGATLSLRTAGGKPVRRLAAGIYAITVRDRSLQDNFHLTGSGLNRRTGVPGKGTVVWKLALEAGVYRFRSDAHPKLGGTFTINPIPENDPATFRPQEQTIPTLLDGTVQASVGGIAGATLQLVDPATGAELAPVTPGGISATVCGQRSLVLRVMAPRPGAFQVDYTTP